MHTELSQDSILIHKPLIVFLRPYFILFITFLVFSCQSGQKEISSQEEYRKGIEVLQATSNNDKAVNKKALVHFEKAAQADPNNLEAKLWKSQIEVKLGRSQEALLTTNSAIETARSMNHRLLPNFYMTAGIAETMNGNQSSANSYFQKSSDVYDTRLEQDKNDTDAMSNKAIALCYMGKKKDALAFLDALARSQDDASMIDQIKADIAQFDTEIALKQFILEE